MTELMRTVIEGYGCDFLEDLDDKEFLYHIF